MRDSPRRIRACGPDRHHQREAMMVMVVTVLTLAYPAAAARRLGTVSLVLIAACAELRTTSASSA
jgi:hypothetical protein